VRTQKSTAGTAAREAEGWNREASQLVCAALVLAIALVAVRIVALW
jgi:hypothetical protein